MKILIVDDNADDRKLLRLNLERHGSATVIEAGDGQEGFELARSRRPDLIISDAMMPRMDGFQLLRLVKGDKSLMAIPFVFHSSTYTGSKDEDLAFALGADAFISKPKEPSVFLEELSAILRGLKQGKKKRRPQLRLAEEQAYLKEYSAVVAAKLEAKVRELEQALAQRKAAETALRIQFTQFGTIFDALNALVYVADMESGHILFMNRYGAMLFGDDWEGKTCAEMFHPRPGEFWGQCSNDMLVRDGVPQQPYVLEFRSPVNGRWYQGIDRAIPWTDGRLVRLQIAFDITERKEVERIKDEMISAVSHELRTPLTAVMGYTEFMLTNELPLSKLNEYLEIIKQEADRLNELIGTFLDVQRQRVRRSTGGFHPVQVRPLLEATAAQFGSTVPSHRFFVDCPDQLPPVLGDGVMLRRMLELLVSNAVKFSPGGGKVCLGAARTKDSITLLVQDQGIGIPVEELDHIFELFYRVDNTDRRTSGGTGLGLALVREIALGHGGKAWAESRLGQGSTFFVSLPVHLERSSRE